MVLGRFRTLECMLCDQEPRSKASCSKAKFASLGAPRAHRGLAQVLEMRVDGAQSRPASMCLVRGTFGHGSQRQSTGVHFDGGHFRVKVPMPHGASSGEPWKGHKDERATASEPAHMSRVQRFVACQLRYQSLVSLTRDLPRWLSRCRTRW